MSLSKQIEAARTCLVEAVRARDLFYPGSAEWERRDAKVTQWEERIRDLEHERQVLREAG